MNSKTAASLASYINQLYKGNTDRELFDYYRPALENCSAEEVNFAIDNLIKRIKDVSLIENAVSRFVRACGKSLDKQDIIYPPESGILTILINENRIIEKKLERLKSAYKGLLAGLKEEGGDAESELKKLLIEEIREFDIVKIHYQKLQYGLFSALEQHSDNVSCFKLMWYIQDTVLKNLKDLSDDLKSPVSKEFKIEIFNISFGEMFFRAAYLIYREEKILYPIALKTVPREKLTRLVTEADSYGIIQT